MAAAIDKITHVAGGKFLQMELIEFTDNRGQKRKWEAVSRTNSSGAALIIPHIVPDDTFILIRQFRPPAGKLVLEFPAGLIDPGEDAATAAVRELSEETGYRGKVVNIAFAVSAAFVFGDHMGFTAGFAPEMLPAMIVGKLVGGISAILVATLLTKKEK